MPLSLSEAVKEACKQPTLLDALSWIAVWEGERAIQQAKKYFETGVSTASMGGWDTLFRICFKEVISNYIEVPGRKISRKKALKTSEKILLKAERARKKLKSY